MSLALNICLIIIALLWSAFGEYGKLAKKDEVRAVERLMVELAMCVDNPQYENSNDQRQSVFISYECERRILRALRQNQ